MMLINEVMYPVNHALRVDMVLPDAVQLILDSGFTGLPVVNDEDRVIGFLSEHDCIPFLLNSSYYTDNRTLVRDIMYSTPLCISSHGTVIDLAQTMSTSKPKVYPVVDEGRLVGIVSRNHIMRELNSMLRSTRVVA
ncbi:MAG: CBS domain-containing protein [Marinobacterium sp.]|nr:CBS domain-containing protein [Marinobacterium sp.]